MFDTGSFNELIDTIIRGLLIPLVPVVTAYLTALIKGLTDDLKVKKEEAELQQYTVMAEKIINTATRAVDQTYISEILKKKGNLTEDEVKAAFNMIKEISGNIISDEVIGRLSKKYTNLDKWLENKIVTKSSEIMDIVSWNEHHGMEVVP